MGFADRIAGYRERAALALERWLPAAATHPERFHTAIRYSVLGGGKRMRSILVYAAAEWLELPPERVDGIAVAIELVHAYSLVHHDLPALGDDRMRLSKAATHVAFDEATAILVGDALQAHAYYVLATDIQLTAHPDVRRQLIVDLARASGSEGVAGGQAPDQAAAAQGPALNAAGDSYGRRTGHLLQAAVLMPCRIGGDPGRGHLGVADRYGRAIRRAIQFTDDPQHVQALRTEALAAIADFGAEANGLRWVCDSVAGGQG